MENSQNVKDLLAKAESSAPNMIGASFRNAYREANADALVLVRAIIRSERMASLFIARSVPAGMGPDEAIQAGLISQEEADVTWQVASPELEQPW